jgi:hypothetical protein
MINAIKKLEPDWVVPKQINAFAPLGRVVLAAHLSTLLTLGLMQATNLKMFCKTAAFCDHIFLLSHFGLSKFMALL